MELQVPGKTSRRKLKCMDSCFLSRDRGSNTDNNVWLVLLLRPLVP